MAAVNNLHRHGHGRIRQNQGGDPVFDKDYLAMISESLLTILCEEDESTVADFLNGLRGNTLKDLFSVDDRHIVKGEHYQRMMRVLKPKAKDDTHDLSTTRRELLPMAIARGFDKVALEILENGCDPYMTGREGSPLGKAVSNGNLAIINKILSSRRTSENPVPHVKTFLWESCRAEDFKVAECLAGHLKKLCGDSILEVGDDFNPLLGTNQDIIRHLLHTLWVINDETTGGNERSISAVKGDTLRKIARWERKHLQRIDPSWLQPLNKMEILVNIDLSHNPLCVLPENLLMGLPHLETLNLSHCSIRSLPALTGDSRGLRLQLLDISYNYLNTAPAELFKIPSLRVLYLNNNAISSIGSNGSDVPWCCSNLEILKLSNNQLTHIPDEITAATKLKDVHIANNKLSIFPLPLEHGSMETLVNIDVSYNPLYEVPGIVLNSLPHLESLNLSHCNLRHIPILSPAVPTLRLKLLDISHNQLHTVPVELFKIASLKHLHLNDNCLSSMCTRSKEHPPLPSKMNEPHGMAVWHCSNLETLCLTRNHLTGIPDAIAGATKLKHLQVAHNKLKTFPRTWQCPMERIDASSNELEIIQDIDVCWSRTLIHLDLANNNFEEIPSTICKLVALQDLNMSNNQIRKLPDHQPWQTSSLAMLNLSGNLLTFVDDDVRERLQKNESDASLRKFWTKHTGCKKVPDWLLTINAKDIAKDNQLVFPSQLSMELQSLNLSSNMLQCVPDTICDMQKLQIVNLSSNNSISKLPLRLAVLRSLVSLTLDEVVITDPPAAANILKATRVDTTKRVDTPAVLKTLREDFLDYKPYRGIKLMVIGPKGSGKTALVNRLLGINRSAANKIVTVTEWARSKMNISKANENIVCTVWEIEGGSSNSTISQALFTPNTIYLLVWDAAKGDIEEIPSWLLNVKLKAQDSPVIAVASHVDALTRSGSKPPGEPMLRAKLLENGKSALCGAIKDEIYVDSYRSNGRGIQTLSKKILETALAMKTTDVDGGNHPVDLIGRKVPKVFLDMKEKMAEVLAEQHNNGGKGPYVMTTEDFESRLRNIDLGEYVISNRIVLDGLIQFLTDTGSFVHISDHTYRLANFYFLDPNWLCQSLSAASDQRGNIKVAKDELKVHAEEYGFDESQFGAYLQLLGRFEIALKASEDSFILPLLLTDTQPYVEGFKPMISDIFRHVVMRWYILPFVPTGFMTRFVCRILIDINRTIPSQSNRRGSYDHKTAWKKGIAIASERQQTNVELLYMLDGSPCICLSIQSNEKELLRKSVGFFVDRIEYLVEEWYADQVNAVRRLAPCPSCLSEALSKPGTAPRDMANNLSHIQDTCAIFQVTELSAKALSNGETTMRCNGKPVHTINLKDMIPDVYLVDVDLKELHNVPRVDDAESRRLGKGSFGMVYQAKVEGQTRAVKSFMKDVPDDTMSVSELAEHAVCSFTGFRRELAMMCRLKHPCILRVYGFCLKDLCFAMELAPMGDLTSYLRDMLTTSAPAIATVEDFHGCILDRMLTFKIAFQLFTALEYLHQEGIIHTDLKTNNIVVFSDDPKEEINVKLIDLGISQSHTAGVVRGRAGQHCFVAPEIIANKAFDEKVDIFSAGMILYHVITGLHPDENQLISSSRDNSSTSACIQPDFNFPDYTMHPDFKSIEWVMEECWHKDPDKRKSATTILSLMRKPGFLSLQNVRVLEDVDTVACFPKQDQKAESLTANVIGCWSGDSGRRGLTEINANSLTQEQRICLSGTKVLCSTSADNLYITGTDRKGIDIYERMRGGAIHRQTLLRSEEFIVNCLLYLDGKLQKSNDTDTQTNYLYVGLNDGRIIVYEHGTLMFSGPTKMIPLTDGFNPCTCLILTVDLDGNSDVVLAGCGDRIMRVNPRDHSVQKGYISIQSSPGMVQVLSEIIYSSNHIWCFLSKSSCVYQCHMSDEKPMASLNCETEHPPVGVNILGGKRPPSFPNARESSISDVGNVQSIIVALDSMAASGYKINQRGRPSSYHEIQGGVHVCSLLIVNDTLWIGRSTGDILVVGREGIKKGEILAVLGVEHLSLKVGSIVRLYKTGSENVIAVSETFDNSLSGYCYHVFRWQGWGKDDVKAFGEALYIPSNV